MKYNSIENIDTITELRKQQKILRKKLRKQEKKMASKFDFIGNEEDGDDLISGILSRFGIKNAVLASVLPIVFQYRKEIIQSGLLQRLWKLMRKNPYISFSVLGASAFYAFFNKYEPKQNTDYQQFYSDNGKTRDSVDLDSQEFIKSQNRSDEVIF